MQLLLMRHGEASYTLGATDKERPLTDRGRAESARAGAWIKAQELTPELILCSSARRTQETLAALGLDAPRVIEDALYLASADELLARGQHHARDHQRVLVIAHNPGLSALASELGSERIGMGTADLVVFDLSDGAATRLAAFHG